MVRFELTGGGEYKVIVVDRTETDFGRIGKDGFYTGDCFIRGFVRVSPDDLARIAAKAREVVKDSTKTEPPLPTAHFSQ